MSKKCPNPECNAVTIEIKKPHKIVRLVDDTKVAMIGLIREKRCLMCNTNLKSYQPKGGEEVYIPAHRRLRFCECGKVATRFEMIQNISFSKTGQQTVLTRELPLCQDCYELNDQELVPVKRRGARFPRQVTYRCGYVGI